MDNISFAILSGGKSSRMGVNKAFLEIQGKSIIETIIDIAYEFSQIMIITNEPIIYYKFGVEVYSDIYPHRGPISGIHSALHNSKFDNVFILSCDMPFISKSTINKIIAQHNNSQITLPFVTERTYFTCGVYSKGILERLNDYLKEGVKLPLVKNRYFALYQLEKMFDINKIKMDEIMVESREFSNINTMEEWLRIKSTCKNVT